MNGETPVRGIGCSWASAACRSTRAGGCGRAVSSTAAEHIPASIPQAGARLTFSDRQLPGQLPPPAHGCARPAGRCLFRLPVPGAGSCPQGTGGFVPSLGSTATGVCVWPRVPRLWGRSSPWHHGVLVKRASRHHGHISEMPPGSASPVPDDAGREHERLLPWSPPAARVGTRCGGELSLTSCGPWTDGGWGRWRERRSCSASLHERLAAEISP